MSGVVPSAVAVRRKSSGANAHIGEHFIGVDVQGVQLGLACEVIPCFGEVSRRRREALVLLLPINTATGSPRLVSSTAVPASAFLMRSGRLLRASAIECCSPIRL